MANKESTLGTRLRGLRKAKGMSLDELATAAGVSRAYLWKLEVKPRANPSLDLLQKLANALGTTVSTLAQFEQPQGDVEVPQSLRDCKDTFNLSESDVTDLARIRFRGGHPTDPEDWYAIYLQLKRATATESDVEP